MPGNRVWRETEWWLAVTLVLACYFPRLDALTIRGEESRRARVAVEMLESGDWVVPRQQGQVYVSRPPLGSWPIAVLGWWRGQVDVVAIRLPTVTAILLTTLLVYWYARSFLSASGALAAALAFATMGQVLELGRLAETEGVLTLLVAASLLIWHAGHARGASQWVVWPAGYALAALAGLAKGPQGPAYFVAATWLWLAWRRDWRWLFSAGHAVGLATFALVLGAWQWPFLAATDWASVRAIWLDNAAERFADSHPLLLARHLATYPLELAACMLPWSLLLLAYCDRRLWAALGAARGHVVYLLTAIAATFPSVWLASGARGRYFMPLYPCFAILVGVVVERVTAASAAAALRRGWQRYVGFLALAAATTASGVALATGLPREPWRALAQPPAFAAAYVVAALALAAALWRGKGEHGPAAARWSVCAAACFLALTFAGVVVNAQARAAGDTAAAVAQARALLPPQAELYSLGRIDHLFAFHYRDPIALVASPAGDRALPAEVTYFCFDEQPDRRVRLPFAHERLSVVPLDRNARPDPQRTVVLARRLPEVARESSPRP